MGDSAAWLKVAPELRNSRAIAAHQIETWYLERIVIAVVQHIIPTHAWRIGPTDYWDVRYCSCLPSIWLVDNSEGRNIRVDSRITELIARVLSFSLLTECQSCIRGPKSEERQNFAVVVRLSNSWTNVGRNRNIGLVIQIVTGCCIAKIVPILGFSYVQSF